MSSTNRSEEIAESIVRHFSDSEKTPTPKQIEEVLRPFAPISWEEEGVIRQNLRGRVRSTIVSHVLPWMEANDVVSGSGPHVEERIRFLLMDTCTCVLDHLPKAIQHATRPVDPRVSALLDHEHLKGEGKK